ncbi:hypothetical protein FM038_023805 [Shewanella eurypsychrophilus]|uniref:Uncharacterized protein n=1 Tax=Shewanella eurypsychrophilus TaxID=2593656 RepID=A0ABX6VDU2_9GAMM|nr:MULTISPECIES: hypothetical protein [Shewanella]QFU24855.1 hypothetical protein FS418_25455 [Shewanella sp. YLB-09]QPG60042.1 hypothetical protein FM038_023805 [Shewanella eurypsychrophilus]
MQKVHGATFCHKHIAIAIFALLSHEMNLTAFGLSISPCSFGHLSRLKRKKPVALATGFIDSLYEKLGAWK